jgi:hypothetical protein
MVLNNTQRAEMEGYFQYLADEISELPSALAVAALRSVFDDNLYFCGVRRQVTLLRRF